MATRKPRIVTITQIQQLPRVPEPQTALFDLRGTSDTSQADAIANAWLGFPQDMDASVLLIPDVVGT